MPHCEKLFQATKGGAMAVKKRPSKQTLTSEDERSPELTRDDEAALDELGNDPGQVGAESGGQSGSAQWLSSIEDANEESVEELSDTDQAYQADVGDRRSDASHHPHPPL